MPAAEERLSQVFDKIAARHALRIDNRARLDPLVRHSGGTELDVMKSLAGQANLIVRYRAVAGCKGSWRVETVRVLPREKAEPTVAKVARPLSPREAADAAAARQATSLYMKGHAHAPTKRPEPASDAASAASAASAPQATRP